MIQEFIKEGIFRSEFRESRFGMGSHLPRYKSNYYSECFRLHRLGVFIEFSVSPNGDGVELFKIEVVNEGKGIGTQIMELLISLSEKFGVEIVLTPNPWKTRKKDEYFRDLIRLSDWYGRLGFTFVGNSVYMKYTPKSSEFSLVG
jgi:hypothetical protein